MMKCAPMRHAAWILLLAGCQPDPDTIFIGDLTIEVQVQSRTDRNWQEVSLRRLYEVPREPDVLLYRPGRITSGPDGSFYCIDHGDLKIKRFDEDGNFIQAYGGIGEGPGEFEFIVDAAVLGDSILYAADLNQRKITFFDVESTDYIRSIPDLHAFRYRITRGGRAYWYDNTWPGTLLYGTSREGEKAHFFGTLTEGQTWEHRMVFGGSVLPYREHMIHVIYRYPIIIQYDSTGAVTYARSTPDWGRAELPLLERIPTGGGLFATRVSGGSKNSDAEVYGDELVTFTRPDSSDVLDVYDAATGDYQSSISLSGLGRTRNATYDPTRERLWQVRDSTIVVYAVER